MRGNFLVKLFASVLFIIWTPLVAEEQDIIWEEKYYPFVYPIENPNIFILAGEIDIRTSLNFKRAVMDAGVPEYLFLNSPGGLVHIALDVALEVNRLGIKTVIPEDFGCYSSCSFIFLAGNTRVAEGELGVHQISSEKEDLYQGQLTLSDIIDVLANFQTPSDLLVTMLRTPPEEMYVFNKNELDQFGFDEEENTAKGSTDLDFEGKISELEAEALHVVGLLMDVWSDATTYDPQSVSNLYDEDVEYYGNNWTNSEVLKDKIAFLERWPVREYVLDERRTQVFCKSNFVCKVDGFVIWRAENPEKGKRASGESRFTYTMKYIDDRFYIQKEDSMVVKRN